MNKRVLFILALAIAAVIILYLYSFGPPAKKKAVYKPNPASLRSYQSVHAAGGKEQIFNVYHNRDVKENFYTITLPRNWRVETENHPGSYALSFPGGNAAIELLDVPDNTTIELYVLSEEEPKLKNSSKTYKRLNYLKSSINGSRSYRLIYTTEMNGLKLETMRTYVTGADHAAVLTFTAKKTEFNGLSATLASVVNSFKWIQ